MHRRISYKCLLSQSVYSTHTMCFLLLICIVKVSIQHIKCVRYNVLYDISVRRCVLYSEYFFTQVIKILSLLGRYFLHLVGCLTKFMLTTKTLFDTGIILGKMHCSRNFIIIGVVLKQILIN